MYTLSGYKLWFSFRFYYLSLDYFFNLLFLLKPVVCTFYFSYNQDGVVSEDNKIQYYKPLCRNTCGDVRAQLDRCSLGPSSNTCRPVCCARWVGFHFLKEYSYCMHPIIVSCLRLKLLFGQHNNFRISMNSHNYQIFVEMFKVFKAIAPHTWAVKCLAKIHFAGWK